jgi:hypothetical protein
MAPSVGAVYFAHGWVVAALISASLPSSADFRIALPALSLMAIAAIVYALLR